MSLFRMSLVLLILMSLVCSCENEEPPDAGRGGGQSSHEGHGMDETSPARLRTIVASMCSSGFRCTLVRNVSDGSVVSVCWVDGMAQPLRVTERVAVTGEMRAGLRPSVRSQDEGFGVACIWVGEDELSEEDLALWSWAGFTPVVCDIARTILAKEPALGTTQTRLKICTAIRSVVRRDYDPPVFLSETESLGDWVVDTEDLLAPLVTAGLDDAALLSKYQRYFKGVAGVYRGMLREHLSAEQGDRAK